MKELIPTRSSFCPSCICKYARVQIKEHLYSKWLDPVPPILVKTRKRGKIRMERLQKKGKDRKENRKRRSHGEGEGERESNERRFEGIGEKP